MSSTHNWNRRVSLFIHKGTITAFANIDPGVNESVSYEQKSILASKKDSGTLHKTLFQVMYVLIKTTPQDNSVYLFINKKHTESKPYYVHMTASDNKFSHIYYGRVKEYHALLLMSVYLWHILLPNLHNVVVLFWYLIFNLYTFFKINQFLLDFLFAGLKI